MVATPLATVPRDHQTNWRNRLTDVDIGGCHGRTSKTNGDPAVRLCDETDTDSIGLIFDGPVHSHLSVQLGGTELVISLRDGGIVQC